MGSAIVFSDNLRKLMRKNYISYTDLSHIVNVSYGTVKGWCHGSTMPNKKNLAKILNFFNVTNEFMFIAHEWEEIPSVHNDTIQTEQTNTISDNDKSIDTPKKHTAFLSILISLLIVTIGFEGYSFYNTRQENLELSDEVRDLSSQLDEIPSIQNEYYEKGHSIGYDEGYNVGYEEGSKKGYNLGLNAGIARGSNVAGYWAGNNNTSQTNNTTKPSKPSGTTSQSALSKPSVESNQTVENPVKTSYFILNTSTGVFHLPSCYHINQMSYDHRRRIEGDDWVSLVAAGYEPCGDCINLYLK